jgi:hypothetical protein
MKIHNVRAGFATNSSSSHSIVMLAPGTSERDDEYSRFEYGWEQFTLSDATSKTAYLAVQLRQALESQNIPTHTAVQLVNSWLGTSYDEPQLEAGYVDHQSSWSLFQGPLGLNPEFVQAYHEWLLKQDVVILGGNDNSDGQTPPAHSYENNLTQLVHTHGDNIRVRKDGAYWVLFDAVRTGNKIRFSFDDEAPAYVKSATPELVDIKLSNWCGYGCEFCYQGSTKQGAHADWLHVNSVLESLADLGVFEVAFGGGEPTHYPHFAQAIRRAAELGITPNFTTFGVDWLQNVDLVQAVQAHVSAIGVSVQTAKDLNKVRKIDQALNQNKGWDDGKVHVTPQHVVGSVHMGELSTLMETSWVEGFDMLLLGYKQTGFGAQFTPHDCEGLDTLLRLQMDRTHKPRWGAKFRSLGVDTAFVQNFESVLQDLQIPHVLITNSEGAFSWYVDCVTQSQGPSSYMPDHMVPFVEGELMPQIAHAFTSWK